MKRAIVLSVLILVVVVCRYPAKADLTVCNSTSQGQIDVAVAYHYTSGNDSYSRSEGYWNIPQGQCRNTLSLTGDEKVYVFAWVAADKTKMWSGANGSGHESGAKQFCIEGTGAAFTYRGDDAMALAVRPANHGCSDSPARPIRMATSPTPSATDLLESLEVGMRTTTESRRGLELRKVQQLPDGRVSLIYAIG